MKTELLLLTMVDEEYFSQDKIFLHRYGRNWIAYEHSAILFCRYFAPVKLQSVILGPARLIYLVCRNISNIQRRIKETEGVVFTYKNEDEIIIHCPSPVSEKEVLKVLEIMKIRDYYSPLNAIGLFLQKLYMKYKRYVFLRNIYMAYGKY